MDSFPISLAFILSVIQVEQRGMFKSQAPLTGVSGGDFFFASSFNVLSFALEKNPRVLVV